MDKKGLWHIMSNILNKRIKGVDSMFCPRCGKHCLSDSKYCERCGYKVGVFSALIDELDELQNKQNEEQMSVAEVYSEPVVEASFDSTPYENNELSVSESVEECPQVVSEEVEKTVVADETIVPAEEENVMTEQPMMPNFVPEMPINENQTEIRYEESETVEEKNIKNYFALSIWSAMLFSFVFGICALIFSAMTQTEQRMGNFDKAKLYSEKTKLFCRFAIVIGIAKLVVIAAVVLAFGFKIDILSLFL